MGTFAPLLSTLEKKVCLGPFFKKSSTHISIREDEKKTEDKLCELRMLRGMHR